MLTAIDQMRDADITIATSALEQLALIRDAFEGRYEAGEQLGEGGFGQVFQARQLATGQLVAIKVLQLQQNRQLETQLARFRREMELCAGLHHPNIVRLIDSGQLGDDVLCTVFEYVPGESLASLLRQGGLEPREATHLMTQVLDALGCAHAAGVAHRDLKPHNIMVTDTGVRRNAMVLDFGIGALVEAAQLDELARLTKTNELLGTPAYAAPEQLRGLKPTTRSDLYSWGLVFLECLTGERALTADNVAELLAKQTGPEPVPIPAWLRSHQLGRVLSRVLVKDVERRNVDAAEIMRELDRREIAGSSLDTLGGHRNNQAKEAIDPDADTGSATLLESLDLERGGLSGEHRQVTAMCCSLHVGRAESSELDLRLYLNLIQAQQRIWGDIIREHGGYFAGSIGGRYLIYFGYPLAKEDDALRALRCARALIEATRDQAAPIAAEFGLEVSATVGVHTGMIVTQLLSSGTLYSDVIGMAPVIAERIDAPPNSVVVSGATEAVVRARFEFEAHDALDCPEYNEPIALFRVVGERGDQAEPEHEFVGRSQELSLLLHRWQLASSGEGQTILLSADVGVGKTHLVREFDRQIPGEHQFLICRCAPEARNSALLPIIELVEQLLVARAAEELGSDSGQTPQTALSDGQRANLLDALLQEFEFESDSFQLLAELLSIPLDPQRYPPLALMLDHKRELTIGALVGLLFELSEQAPLLFVVEDIQWADPSTLALLEQLFAEVETSSACVVLTARPEFEAPAALEFAARVKLTQLGRDEVVELLAKLSGGVAFPPALVEQIIERADGVPLFVEALAEMLLNNLRAAGESTSSFEFEVPASLRDALTARLDRLGPAKRTAHVASALGREFSAKLLERIAREFAEGDVKTHAQALTKAGLLTRKRRRGAVHYTFKHALVREVAHEAMMAADRRAIHTRIASTLEQDFAKVVATRPDLLAMHHHHAGNALRAVQYAQQAAIMAMLRSANVEAGAHAREALRWLPEIEDPRARAEAELDLNGILTKVVMLTQGHGAVDMEALLARSELLISELGDSKQVFPNLAAFVAFQIVRGNIAAAQELAERLLAIAETGDDSGQKVHALSTLSQISFFAGQFAKQREYSERALALFDPLTHGGLLFLYGQDAKITIDGFLCANLTICGQLDAGVEVARRNRERAQTLNIPHLTYTAYYAEQCMHYYRGDKAAVVALSDEVRALAAAHGGSWYVMLAESLRGWAEGNLETMRRFVGMTRAMGASFARGFAAIHAAEVELAEGHPDHGLELIDFALQNVDDGSRMVEPEMHRLKALLLAAKHDDTAGRQAAIASIRAALRTANETGACLFQLRAAVAMLQLSEGLELDEDPRDNLATVLDSFEDESHPEVESARSLFAQ